MEYGLCRDPETPISDGLSREACINFDFSHFDNICIYFVVFFAVSFLFLCLIFGHSFGGRLCLQIACTPAETDRNETQPKINIEKENTASGQENIRQSSCFEQFNFCFRFCTLPKQGAGGVAAVVYNYTLWHIVYTYMFIYIPCVCCRLALILNRPTTTTPRRDEERPKKPARWRAGKRASDSFIFFYKNYVRGRAKFCAIEYGRETHENATEMANKVRELKRQKCCPWKRKRIVQNV